MPLADKLNQPPRARHGMPCGVQVLLDKLADEPSELAAFQAMLADPKWSATAIRKAVMDEGHEVPQQTIGRHRVQACRCFSGRES